MPNTNVEIIISGTTGIMSNAASDASLQELLKAVKNLESNSSAESNNSINNISDSIKKGMSDINDAINDYDRKTARMIKKGFDLFKGAMDRNTNTLADFASVINENLIKKIPIAGGWVGGLVDVFILTAATVEGWNNILKTTSSNGATFGNSALRLRHAAATARMNVDDFAKLVRDNSEGLAIMARTAFQGADELATALAKLYDGTDTSAERLLQLGYTQSDASDIFARYLTMTNLGDKGRIENNAQTNKAFISYMENYDMLLKLTGQDSKALQAQIRRAEGDVIYQKQLAKLDPQEQRKMRSRLTMMTSKFGDSGAELHKVQVAGAPVIADGPRQIMQYVKGMGKILEEDLREAKDPRISEIEYNQNQIKRNAQMTMSTVRFVRENRSYLQAVAGTAEGMRMFGPGLQQDILNVLEMGDITELTDEAVMKRMMKAKKEQDEYGRLNMLLDRFSLAFREARKAFFDSLIPTLEAMGEGLKHLPELLKQMGVATAKWIKEVAFPAMLAFYNNMTSPEGRNRIKTSLANWVSYLGTEIRIWAKQTILLLLPETVRKYVQDFLENPDDTRARENLERSVRTARAGGGMLENNAPQPALNENYTPGGTEVAPQLTRQVEAGAGINTQEFGRLAEPTTTTVGRGRTVVEAAGKITQRFNKVPELIPGANVPYDEFQMISPTNNPELYRMAYTDTTVSFNNRKTPIKAAMDADVINAGLNGDHRMVELWDPNAANGKGLTLQYMRFDPSSDAIFDQIRGKRIKKGDLIGYSMDSALLNFANPNIMNLRAYLGKPDTGERTDPMLFMKNPFQSGTLGMLGKLFGEFGAGTPAMLHGQEAVVTPQQLEGIVKSKDQIQLGQFISSLNTNMTNLLEIAREELYIDNTKSSVQKAQKLPFKA